MTTTATDRDTADTPEPGGLDSRQRLILAVCCVAQFLVILDLSIVNVALPTIQSALTISATDLQWVIDAYAVIFAGFLMLAGRASDLFGQRRTFSAALVVFTLASLACGLAQSSLMLIIARGAQGLAGAGMAAASLAILMSTFPPGPARHRAIALWGSMNGAGGAAGTLLGGVLTDVFSWRWVFLINVPIALVAIALVLRSVPERRGDRSAGFDLPGALVLTVGLLIATYGGVTAGSEGFGSAEALIPIAIGSLLLTLFPLVERRAAAPLIPPGSLTGLVRKVNLIVLLFSASLFAMWYAGSLYLQQVLSLSPLEAGLTFLPMALVIFLAARPAGKLATRAGVRPVLGGGLLMLATGLVLLSRIGSGGSAIQYVMVPGFLVAIGIGFSVVASTIAATQHAGPGQAGLSSSLVNTARQVGGGLGLAVLLSIATQRTSDLIGEGDMTGDALTSGFSLAYLVGAGLVAVAAVLTFLFIPRSQPAQRPLAGRVLAGVATVIALFVVAEVAVPRTSAAPAGEFTLEGAETYVSAPGLHPPKIYAVKELEGEPPSRFLMTANFLDVTKPPIVGQSGPLILDYKRQPVWFKPVPVEMVAGNLNVQQYQGKPVLVWWQGVVGATGEIDSGEVVVVDQSYKTIATLKGTDGWLITLHDVVIDGDLAWVTANRNLPADLSGVGGVNHGVLVDSALQAYDLRTGKLVHSWSAREHIPMAESDTQPPPNGFPWDAYHINSLQLLDGDRALISMRNTSAGYLIDRTSGQIIWRLGGKQSDFDLPPDAQFEWQHDLLLKDDGQTVSLFDNHCCEITGAGEYIPSDRGSRAIELKLDETAKTATLVREYSHGDAFRSQYMGNEQELENGNRLVNWGQVPFVSEYTEDGKLLFDMAFPTPNMTYRAYAQDWVGRPSTPPSAVVRGGALYASWNGATELASWRVLADGSGEVVTTRPKSGFETKIDVPAGRYRVEALDADGRVLGTTTTKGPS